MVSCEAGLWEVFAWESVARAGIEPIRWVMLLIGLPLVWVRTFVRPDSEFSNSAGIFERSALAERSPLAQLSASSFFTFVPIKAE